ncbi:hypothetical protein EW093_10860 [Thiospirochaeta perfilievii]|uniref:Envelope stress response membrane protein PspB n=1 Tax=Thiospirochaeta perfilievii TaxID=252967 RepID=A0A5C1QDP2_9SPIO|nr:hypothetical protein [Thiospirochaeta perfilievii]QEN05190.1 hypothetical protein EW093_10860 [Thiospirochaeta perfilievii]
MYNPQEFVLGILFIVVGIPVISGTIVSLVHGPKELRKEKWRKRHQDSSAKNDKESEMLEEIYYGLSDLNKRVKNLETILEDQGE